MRSWEIACNFIGDGKSFTIVVTRDVYESFAETANTYDACFHDIGMFLDDRLHGSSVVSDMAEAIPTIALDFLKKTPSFSRLIETGLPYAAFTIFRSDDWSLDSPNYRYRFLGAYRDRYSDHKLWSGNTYFSSDDYHPESVAHKYMRGETVHSLSCDIPVVPDNSGGLYMGSRLASPRSAKAGGFRIDIPEKAEALMDKLKASLPIVATIPAWLAKELAAKSPEISIPKQCKVLDVVYSGDVGGILCCLDNDSANPLVVSITNLVFNRSIPLAREIDAYQRHRIKKLKQQPTYH